MGVGFAFPAFVTEATAVTEGCEPSRACLPSVPIMVVLALDVTAPRDSIPFEPGR